MHVTDHTGEEFALQATTTNDGELNSNQSVSLNIFSNKVNDLFINEIDKLWTVTDLDNVEHKIIYLKKQGIGKKLTVSIKGIPLFFDVLDNDRIYERYDSHMTAQEAFTLIFKDTGFTFVLVDSFLAVQWEGFGDGESKLESFKRALNRYKCEFRISGNTVYLETRVGRDTNIMYRHRLNASNIIQEIDASQMWTYARGYGDYEDSEDGGGWENAKLVREYTSPLAKLLDVRHAPPIKDGRVKIASEMDNSLKTLVDESLKISVSADIHDLRKQNYPIGQTELGDRVFLIDERIDLDDEVRVVSQSVTRDWQGNVLDITLTFGSEGITKRHQSKMQTAMKNIEGLLEGKVKLPFNALDNAVLQATQALKSAQTELIFDNGIIAQEKTDPNKLVLFNSAGLGISVDGGNKFKTAITADGIVADAITTGTLRSILIEGVEIYGSKFISRKNNDTYARIENSTIESKGTHRRQWGGEDEINTVRVKIENGQLRFRNDDKDWSLYTNDRGISTMGDGTGDAADSEPSGMIEFHSTLYAPESGARGLTIYSGARLALESNSSRIYINPNGAGVHISDINENYYSIAASSFTQSSSSKLKRDIKDLEGRALDVVNSMRIREWKRLTNGQATKMDKWQAGLILEEAPVQMIDGTGIDLYTMTSYNSRAIQELCEEFTSFKEEMTGR